MSSQNTGAKQKVLARIGAPLKKELDLEEPAARSVLEQILYAIVREGLSREHADKAFDRMVRSHFDLNEIRVSTAREVADLLRGLPLSFERADRLISVLQEIFETTYGFELDNVAKKGLKLAEKQLERYRGTTPFVVAYVLQNALGGHAIPLDADMIRCLARLELTAEAAPLAEVQGMLEHQVPKAKGPLFFEALSAVAHRYCHERQPQCPACPLLDACPTGQRHKARKASKPEAARAAAPPKKAKAAK